MKKLIPVILFFILVFIAGWMQHDNLDLYGHFAMGRVIAQQGIPHHEVMTQAGSTRAYIPIEWLFQIVIYWFLTIFGFSSYHLFNAILTTLQLFVLFILLKKLFKVNLIFSLLICCSYLLLNYNFFVQRPQQISYIFLIVELIIIYKFLLENKNYLFFLIPIVYLWTNIHASFFVGILICLGYSGFCFLGIFSKNKKIWLKKSIMLFFITIGMIASSILPPQKFGEYQDLYLMYKNNYIMRTVVKEWVPLYKYFFPTIYYSTLMLISLLIFLIVTIRKKIFTKSMLLLPLLAFIPTAYIAIRNSYYGYLVATLISGWALAHIKWSKSKIIVGIILFIVVLSLEGYPAVLSIEANYYEWPEKAADFILKENIQGNMFNQFTYGDYLEYRLYPAKKVFMDGGAEPFFCCEMKDFYTLQINSKKSVDDFQGIFDSFFDKYKFSYAVLVTKNDSSGIEMSTLLGRNPLWFLVYKDDLSEIWIKNDGKNPELTNKLTKTQLSPDINIFSNEKMNIVFNYPKDFKIFQLQQQLISVNRNDKDINNALLIYSTRESLGTHKYKVPFSIAGNVTSSQNFKLRNFDAQQITYSQGKNGVIIMVLKQNQQVVILRIPQDSSTLSDAITDIANSIKIINQ